MESYQLYQSSKIIVSLYLTLYKNNILENKFLQLNISSEIFSLNNIICRRKMAVFIYMTQLILFKY